MEPTPLNRWFPFRAVEVELALAALGVLLAVLAAADHDATDLLKWAALFLAFVYLAGLFSRAGVGPFVFIADGAERGAGYLPAFKRAKRSLFLMHVDDDAPTEELQGLYRTLLSNGVQIRRAIFLRPDGHPKGYEWIRAFGNHPNLAQRVVLPEDSRMTQLSFVLVDDRIALVALPGVDPIQAPPFSHELVFRHLIAITEPTAVATFLQVYEAIWTRALPLEDVNELSDFAVFLERARGRVRTRP